jgi:hypothetical protein
MSYLRQTASGGVDKAIEYIVAAYLGGNAMDYNLKSLCPL